MESDAQITMSDEVMRRILNQMLVTEIRKILISVDPKKGATISNTASKNFLINKILELKKSTRVIKNDVFINQLLLEYRKSNKFIIDMFNVLKKEDYENICDELKLKKSIKQLSKKEILYYFINEISLDELWKSKTLKDRFTPKYVVRKDIDNITSNLNSFKKELLKNGDKKNRLLENRFNILEENLNNYFSKLSSKIIKYDDIYLSADYKYIMNNLYKEYVTFNNEDNVNDMERIIKIMELQKGYSLKELKPMIDIMLTHYIINIMKNIEQRPSKELFLSILKEKYLKINHLGTKAEIPLLRKKVCERLNITENLFDEFIEDLWKNRVVRLEVGAPIGNTEVKYLTTKTGTKFYYIIMEM